MVGIKHKGHYPYLTGARDMQQESVGKEYAKIEWHVRIIAELFPPT